MRNKKYLLDTNIFIWLIEKNHRVSEKIFHLLANPQIQVFVSVASIWEIVIKRRKTPLKVPKDIIEGIYAVDFSILPIEAVHVMAVEKLPLHHKDPFDRILIAQAKEEKLTLVTNDEKIRRYKIKTLS